MIPGFCPPVTTVLLYIIAPGVVPVTRTKCHGSEIGIYAVHNHVSSNCTDVSIPPQLPAPTASENRPPSSAFFDFLIGITCVSVLRPNLHSFVLALTVKPEINTHRLHVREHMPPSGSVIVRTMKHRVSTPDR